MGDVLANVTYTNPQTGDTITTPSIGITVVKVSTTTVATTPATRNRKILGVGEEVNLEISPVLQNISVSSIKGDVSNVDEYGKCSYEAPHGPNDDSISVTIGEVNMRFDFSILAPIGFIVKSIYGFSNSAENIAGGFYADIYYVPSPTNVSFYALEFIEVGMMSNDPTGYFTNSNYAAWMDHSQNGAGKWFKLLSFDDMFVDTAVMPVLPQPWGIGGGFTWPIPVAWRFDGEIGGKNVICNYDQRFELDADGTSRIRKMGCLVEQTTNHIFTVAQGGQ
jgi:hypothetical protein